MKGLSEWEKLLSWVSGFIARWPLYFRRTAFISVLAIVCALCMVLPTNAGADIAGPNNPSSGSNNSSIGNTSWSNTSNIRYSDNSDARASLSGGRTSNYLVATDFGFSIPSNATITGIKVDIEKADGNQSSSAYIRDNSVKIVKNGSITGSDHANTSTNWSTSDNWSAYGSTSDLWGTTWTPADINSGNFGAALSARNTSSSSSEYAYVDNMRITVYYSVPPPCTANAPTVSITPSSQTITTNGGNAAYSMTIKNNDSGSGCSNVTYSLSSSDSNTTNFNATTLSSSSVILAAGATSSAIALTVSGKAGHTSGIDTTIVTASSSGHSNGSSSVTTTLNVPTCTANAPTVSITPSSQTITTNGGSAVYSMTIKNNDIGSVCSNVTYSLSSSDSNTTNFNASTFGSSSVILAAGTTSSAIALTVSGKAGHTSGTETTTVTASASGHTNGSGSATTTLNVYVPPVFDSSGPNNPSVGYNNNSTGQVSWSYTSYVKSSDNSDARVYLDDHDDHHNQISNYLVATGFGFSIPSNATITGIKLDIEKAEGSNSSYAYIRDNSVKIVKNGSVIGSEHANTSTNWSTSDQWTSYGSDSDLWGTTWTPADINSGNFGAAISAKNTSSSKGEYAYVDNMRITVHFSVPSPCTESAPTVNITPSSQTITTNGGSAVYSITITNNDAIGCLNATYSLSASDSNTINFNASTLGSNSVTLAPGATSSAITLTTSGKAGQTTGTDTTTVKASASGHADGSNSVITTLDVAGCIAMAPTVSITPYSRTITTNGGTAVYSMTIRNNDAGIGCLNVTYSLSASDSNTTDFNASVLGSSSVTLAKGATSPAIALTASGKAGQTSGTNSTTVTASASGQTNGISNAVTTTLNISATNTYSITTCNGCHKTVPVDSTGQRGTPPTAVIGSHSVHAAVHGNACTTCHIDANNLGHRNGMINMKNPINGGSYSKGASFPQVNDMTGAGLGTCSSTYCHGSAGTSPKWGTNTSKIGTCDLCHGMVGIYPSRDTEGHTAVTDPQVGAHNAHLNATHNISSKMACNECHTVPADLDSSGHYDTARPAEVPMNGTIANSKGAMPSYSAGKCSSTWCHGAKLFEGDKPPSWNVPLLTGDKNNDCTKCHGFPPSQGVHSGLDVNIAGACAACHDHVNATNDGFIDPSKHINGTVEGGSCLGCHSTPKGKRGAVVGQFSANSHHVQGVTLTDEHCYQCHWEANSDGSLNSTYHEGLAISGAPVDLVIYGNGARPSAYTLGTTVIKYTANGQRTEIQKINQHCISCHSTQNNTVQPFADGKTPKQYSWDGSSVGDRYSQTGTTAWGKYSGTNITPKNTQTKAYSAHGNASANQRGWNTSETWPNTSGTSQVLCFDCHNSHGSTVSGTTTSYTSALTNGGILKDTTANMGGYAMNYKPVPGGSTADKNAYKAGAGLCFDCHMTANGGTTKPWGYQATFGASQAVMGYMDTQYFGAGTFGRQLKYSYKSTANMGGHFGASSAMTANASKAIGGLCTPCHDPHGVSTTLGTNQKYGVPLLKGTWLTSPYKEDATTADNQNYIAIAAFYYNGEYEGPNRSQAKKDAQAAAMKAYRIDQNTFGSGDSTVMNSTLYSITETDTQFAGLCLNCHQKQNLTNGTTHTWKSKDRVHESVKGWKTANTTKQHFYTCSKCHAPHNASLPRLMVSNCLDFKHRGRVTNNSNPITSGSYRNGGSGSGRMPGSYSARVGEDGRTTINKTFTCHENNDSTQKWNAKTPWVK